MAVTLSITVTDAQAARCQIAFGHFDNSIPSVWVNATASEIRAVILNFAKGRVLEYETAQVANNKRSEIGAESW